MKCSLREVIGSRATPPDRLFKSTSLFLSSVVILLLSLFLAIGHAQAQCGNLSGPSTTWNAGDGSWSVGSNWTSGTPDASTNAWILNSPSVFVTLDTTGNVAGLQIARANILNAASGGSLNLISGPSFNDGTLAYGGGTINSHGTLNNDGGLGSLYGNFGTINNYATINNSGVFVNNPGMFSTINNYGTINNAFELSNFATGTLNNAGTINNTLGFVNSGAVTIGSSGLFLTSTNYTQLGGGSTLVDGRLTTSGIAVVDIQTGALSGTGTINGNVL